MHHPTKFYPLISLNKFVLSTFPIPQLLNTLHEDSLIFSIIKWIWICNFKWDFLFP